MTDSASPWWFALALAAPFCCGGLALLGAGGLASLGAFFAWKGAWLLASAMAVLTIGAVWWWRRRRTTCEP